MRTQDEIAARIDGLTGVIKPQELGDDAWGFRREVLYEALDLEHARPYLKSDAPAGEWVTLSEQDLQAIARSYYAFAVGKIESHRGMSASRSVVKLREYAWLLGQDDAVTAMDAAEYEQYGAPKVKAWGAAFGEPWPDEPWAKRMAEGLSCEPGCAMGCGR